MKAIFALDPVLKMHHAAGNLFASSLSPGATE